MGLELRKGIKDGDMNLDIVLVSSNCYNKKCHRLGGLNNKLLFSVLEAEKSELKELAYLVTGESSLPGL